MAHDKGIKFWKDVVYYFNGKQELTDKDYEFCDSLDNILKTDRDKSIQAFFDILIENSEQKEKYFKKDMMKVIHENYGM